MKRLALFLLLSSTILQAQYKVTGKMNPAIDSDWMILYTIEGARQLFVNNTRMKIDSVTINGKKSAIATFTFNLPENTKPGAFRATYRTEGAAFVDFFFNKEDVSFVFNPDYPNETVTFSASRENKIYQEYLNKASPLQQSMDSLQVVSLKDPNANVNALYQQKKIKLDSIHKSYVTQSKGMYVEPFIQATLRKNSTSVFSKVDDYMNHIKSTFFDGIDFTNKNLINSSFLTDRMLDYIFFLNYSENQRIQQELFRNSTKEVLVKITDLSYRQNVIEFLTDQFQAARNVEMVDHLLNDYYKKLPLQFQDQKFIDDKVTTLAAEIGRIAPNFSWQENGKTMDLKSLADGDQYVLVFYSTTCSHCLREIPQLHAYMKSKSNVKVIAFALENDRIGWDSYRGTLPGWHHVLGLEKWQNKTARTYQVNATPSYFVLNNDKKIIAKPDAINDVKAFFSRN